MPTQQTKASKWDSLIKWIKETKEDEDTDIWEKLEELGISASGEEIKEEEVVCVGCNEVVCKYSEEPPHKDERDEALCDECYKL